MIRDDIRIMCPCSASAMNGNANSNHYRVSRNGRYYNTDGRGAELLRQAVNAGYQQGYSAGQADRMGGAAGQRE